jgi:rRNA maturation endonuclease Nob1
MSRAIEDVVLDSGALIGCATTSLVSSIGSQCRVWTIPEVLEEIKDAKSRQALDALPFKLLLRTIEPEALRAGNLPMDSLKFVCS